MKAATGEDVTAEELGGADVHTRTRGVADHFAEDDEHALAITREIVAPPEPRRRSRGGVAEPERAALRPRRALRHRPADPRKPYDVREIIARMVDGSRCTSSRRSTATTLVCGFARIWATRSASWRTTASSSPRAR